MVDLDTSDCRKSPPEAVENALQVLSDPVKQLCRLCLHENEMETDKFVDIFDEPPQDEQGKKTKAIEELLYDLFSIKYEKCLNMPRTICKRCWEMVQAFNSFRCLVQQCEELLQKRLKLLQSNAFVSDNEENRPGLNGNPGEFVPDDDCEIEEVNPEQDFESSDDDFSMESDTEPDDVVSQVKSLEVNGGSENLKPAKPVITKEPLFTSPNNVNAKLEPTKINDITIVKEPTPSNVPMEHTNLEFTIKNTYTCQYCDMAFTTQNECTDHESLHDPSAPFLCNFCHLCCGSRQTLIAHIKETHDPDRPYICVLCSKGFCRRSDLKKHSIVHTGIRPFVCPICSKSFSRNTNLTKHMRIHSSIKPYVCQQCPRSFTTGLELSRHGRTHTETRAFKCNKCPATYARKDKLQMHELSHIRKEADLLLNPNKPPHNIQQNQSLISQTAENMENVGQPINPYINTEINQIKPADNMQQTLFPPNQYVQKPLPQVKPTPPPKTSHGRIHNCDICNKSFTRERDFQRHQALHLDTLFTCKQCGIGFSRREKLARHELEHHGPQYSCETCRITFHKREELEMHLKMHELQQNAAISTHQAALNASGVVHHHAPIEINQMQHHHSVSQTLQQSQPPLLPPIVSMAVQRPTPADISFYSNMVPTMNLGFYSETRPEDRNGI